MAKKSAKQHAVFTPQDMLPSENWADQTDRLDAQQHDKEISAEQTLLHTRQTMSPIAQPAIDVNLMATMMQQMLKSQEQLHKGHNTKNRLRNTKRRSAIINIYQR